MACHVPPVNIQLGPLSCPRNDASKTTLRIHHEGLADAAEREAMREHWRAALDEVAALVAAEGDDVGG